MNILNIFDKKQLVRTIEQWESESILGSENLADTLIACYVFGNNSIPNMTKTDIFYECIEIYIIQARKGAIHSKWCIASHLIGCSTYLCNDLVLANLLINLAAYENEPNACLYVMNKYQEFGNPDIAQFWESKSKHGFTNKVVGEKVDLALDNEYRIVYMR